MGYEVGDVGERGRVDSQGGRSEGRRGRERKDFDVRGRELWAR